MIGSDGSETCEETTAVAIGKVTDGHAIQETKPGTSKLTGLHSRFQRHMNEQVAILHTG